MAKASFGLGSRRVTGKEDPLLGPRKYWKRKMEDDREEEWAKKVYGGDREEEWAKKESVWR